MTNDKNTLFILVCAFYGVLLSAIHPDKCLKQEIVNFHTGFIVHCSAARVICVLLKIEIIYYSNYDYVCSLIYKRIGIMM